MACCAVKKAEAIVQRSEGTRLNGLHEERVGVFAVACRPAEKMYSSARVHVGIIEASVVHLCTGPYLP